MTSDHKTVSSLIADLHKRAEEAEKLLDEAISFARSWAAQKEALVHEVPADGKERLLSQSIVLKAFANELTRRQEDRLRARKAGKR